ncbi:alpha/beta fold hydrolase [Robertmurraya massiliosenegalensis]|uniref:alpha/beta fold hydrolase n=1 Tax=Robertmurraya massiliosenegalensis TaxID=1287657 RepID=UPI0003051755|nr:alpha/beta hydrolase [Robertmurraya massiliosenegalensis]
MNDWQNLQQAGLTKQYATVNGIRIHYVEAGNEHHQTVVLLHGFPQSWLMWRYLLPELIKRYHVIAVDLRGYGDSEKPAGINGYDKGTMARDVYELLASMGIQKISLIGHDRGARVARRFALDYSDTVTALSLIDILPMELIYDQLSVADAAKKYWHWTFQLVPNLPEALIEGREDVYLQFLFNRSPELLEKLKREGVWQEYLRVWKEPGGYQSTLHDYRATYEVDLPKYRAERQVQRKLTQPCLLLWGENGNLANLPVLDYWKEVATTISGKAIANCGHYVPEEQPESVLKELLPFLEEMQGRF